MNKGTLVFLLIEGVPLTICVLLSSVSAFFYQDCAEPIGLSLILAFVTPIALCSVYLVYFSASRSKPLKMFAVYFTLISSNSFYSAAVYCMIATTASSPLCMPRWVEIVDWGLLGCGATTIAMPSIFTILYHFILLHRSMSRKSKKTKAINKIFELYDQDCDLEGIFKDPEVRVFIEHLNLQQGEREYVRQRYKVARMGEGEEETSGKCVGCGRLVGAARPAVCLPGCGHLYHEECFESHFSNNEPYCVKCTAHVRRSIFKSIHKADVYLYSIQDSV